MCILMLTSIGLCDVVLEAVGTKLRQATRPRESQALVFRTNEPTGEQCGLQTRIAATESVSLCVRTRN